MKKLLFLLFFGALFIGTNAQNSSSTWLTTGNDIMSASHFFGTTNGSSIIFKTSNIERMRLLGNKPFLGVGLSNPTAPLHVHYQMDPFLISSEDYSIIRLTTSETGNAINKGFSIYSISKEIIFKQHESAKFSLEGPGGGLTILANGDIGIGTKIPKQKLHIVDGNILISKTSAKAPGSINGSILFGADVTNSNHLGNWGIEYLNSDDPQYGGYGLNFWKTGHWNYALFLADNGNVGIGKKDLQAKLDVNGSFKAESATINGALTANGATINGAANIIGALTAQSATIPTINGNTNVTGTLYVNTINGQSANINGKIKTKEVEVTLSGWKDYVFEENYPLMTLQETEDFIKEHKHLPNVPSAAEVEANGVNLGEMNAILIQKVEELTLYILDLQKQINELKTK